MEIVINKSGDRGFSDYGWLKARHSFSFGEYFNPVREKFGVIRVLNEELLLPQSSLEMHEYRDLEIMLLLLEGSVLLEAPEVITRELAVGDIALISAGRGLKYALHNRSEEKPAGLLQVWFFPNIKNAEPSLNLLIKKEDHHKELTINPSEQAKPLNQDVWIKRIGLEKEKEFKYSLQKAENQVLVFALEGEVIIKGEQGIKTAAKGDTIEIIKADQPLVFSARTDSELLIIETIPD